MLSLQANGEFEDDVDTDERKGMKVLRAQEEEYNLAVQWDASKGHDDVVLGELLGDDEDEFAKILCPKQVEHNSSSASCHFWRCGVKTICVVFMFL